MQLTLQMASAALAALALFSRPANAQLPESALAVEVSGAWREWWTSSDAPTEWHATHPAIARALNWRRAVDGIALAELRIAGRGEAWRLRVILARIDQARVALRPVFGGGDSTLNGRWNIGDAHDVLFAVNAGQFGGLRPWGWVVRDGHELQPPGYGPLSSALIVDTLGGVHLVASSAIPAARAVRHAFQSYPTILERGGFVPNALRAEGRGVNLRHRDARLAIGILHDSTLLIALTRFEGLGGVLDVLPFGLTTPEMAALMGALGCTHAMLLDGGISGQLAVRDSNGAMKRWPGLRNVPMGLVGISR